MDSFINQASKTLPCITRTCLKRNYDVVFPLPPPLPKEILPDMKAFMKDLRGRITVGVVGGSDFVKQKEQLGETGECVNASPLGS